MAASVRTPVRVTCTVGSILLAILLISSIPVQARTATLAGTRVNVIMKAPPGGSIWPGGVAVVGKKYAIVYQLNDPAVNAGLPTAYLRMGSNLLGSFGAAMQVSANGSRAYDPGIAVIGSGDDLVTVWHDGGDQSTGLQARLREGGVWSAPYRAVYDGSDTQEASLTRVNTAVFATYNVWETSDFDWSVRVRTISATGTFGPPVVAGRPAGFGLLGRQLRQTLSPTGLPGELIVVWSQPANPTDGGYRFLAGAISQDGGQTWGPSFTVASQPGRDLHNPFVILVGTQLRVYYGPSPGNLGEVVSTDNGRTWSAPTALSIPVRDVARPVVQVVNGVAVCFGSFTWNGRRVLGTFRLP